MSEAEIEKRRKVSPSQKGNADAVGVWLAWGDEMRKKTVLRGLCKLLPLSTQMQHAVNADQTTMEPEQFYNGEVVGVAEYDEALDAVVVEAGDLQKIRDGVQDCMDVDALEAYWKQNADEWKSRPDVKAVFGERKKQLNG